jgi:cell wall assembly regulator SMI1
MTKRHIIIALLLSGSLIIVLGVKYCMNIKNELFYPTIVNSIPPVSDAPTALLNEFEDVLKEKNKVAYDALNPGLTADEIHKMEEEYHVKLSEEIVTLYMWHNGCSDFAHGLMNGEIIPGHWFVPLKYALDQNKSLNQGGDTFVQKVFFELFAGHTKSWIVLFDDGCGDGYFCDPVQKSGSGYVFYHSMEGMYYVYFSSLKNLFKAFIECYQKDIYKLDNIMELKDYEAAAKVMSKYGVSVN